MNIWGDFLGDIEVPDDYIEKKYKNLSSFKKQRENGIIRYEDFLFLTDTFPLLMLRHSLISDLRIYGAEWQEEKDWLADYMGWIIYHKYSWLKNVDQT